MRNSEYVEANAFVKDTHHGNLFTDSNGTMYSYGYHYPLLFEVNGLTFVNTAGYSNTTSKHISYARSFARYEVELYRNQNGAYAIDYASVMYNLEKQLQYIDERISELKRHNTKKEANLLNDRSKVIATIEALRSTSN